MNKRKHLTEEQSKQVQAAQGQIIDYLVGDMMDMAKLQDAVKTLEQYAPQSLVQFSRSIESEILPYPTMHAYVLEHLAEYLDLGKDAAVSMPEIHEHLQSCSRCQEELEYLVDSLDNIPNWIALSNPVAAEQERETAVAKKIIALVGNSWKWLNTKTQEILGDVKDDQTVFGQWQLIPAASTKIRFKGLAKPLAFMLSLPDEIIKIEISVEPDAPKQETIWRTRLRSQKTARTPEKLILQAAYGHENERISGFRALTAERPIEFELLPVSSDNPYVLYFEWSVDNVTQAISYVLPLIVAKTDE
jgi:hypothetical protein